MGEEGIEASPDGERHHTLIEDAAAILLGTMLVALGLVFFTKGLLVTGGLAGMALIIFYLTDWPFGLVFFFINLPFYILAFWRMGWQFALRTIVAVVLVSAFSSFIPHWISLASIHPLFAAASGGGMMGLGMLVLFRHRSSVGGINILALYMQERYGLRAGYFQLGIDVLVLLTAFLVLPWERVAISLVGAGILNLILAMNHKPGRYMGFS